MKKVPLTLALLAAAGAASAQSSVTLFGIIDASVSSYNAKSRYYGIAPGNQTLVAPPDITKSQTVLSSGNYLPSRLGFRGTEDLGGGLAASFWLEAPMTNDDGGPPLVFSRRSTVSLSGVAGEIRLGRDYTPTFWVDTLYDPFNNIGVGANLIGSVNGRLAVFSALSGGGLLNGGLPGGPDNYVRTSNSVGYFLPRGLGGFYGQVIYAFPEGNKSPLVPGSPSQRGGLTGARFGYLSGPLDISSSYVESTPVDAVPPFTSALLDRKIKSANLGGSYDLGPAKLFGEISHVKDDTKTAVPLAALGITTAQGSSSYDGALLGVSVPIGASTIRAAYSYVKFDNGAAPATFAPALDTSAAKLSLGYVYNLSKRTLLYATAAYIRIKDGQNNPTVMAVPTGSTAYLTTGGPSGYAPRSSMGYDFGISHSF